MSAKYRKYRYELSMKHSNDLAELATLRTLCAPLGAVFSNPPPNVQVYERTSVNTVEAQVYDPLLCIVLQGRKKLTAGDREIHLEPGNALVVNQYIPATYQITEASEDKPFLAIALTLNLSIVRDFFSMLEDMGRSDKPYPAMVSGACDVSWLTPLIRYLSLVENPQDLRILGPATLSEIHYRLLMSSTGRQLRHLLSVDSHANRISRAIGMIREHFQSTLVVQDVAEHIGMSASSFHSHFKAVTGTTPLQFQKDVRLIAAREMLKDRSVSVSTAAFEVGYESPAHFSRDFKRKFGKCPSFRHPDH